MQKPTRDGTSKFHPTIESLSQITLHPFTPELQVNVYKCPKFLQSNCNFPSEICGLTVVKLQFGPEATDTDCSDRAIPFSFLVPAERVDTTVDPGVDPDVDPAAVDPAVDSGRPFKLTRGRQ